MQSPRAYRVAVATVLLGSAAALALLTPNQAEGQVGDPRLNAIKWEKGPCVGVIGNGLAQVKVPAGCKFSGREGTVKLLEVTQNTPTPRDLGVIVPDAWPAQNTWFLTFEWDEVGYVKDDEKNDLKNPEPLLTSMRSAQDADNANRRARGWPTLTLVGWEKPPFYDPNTNNLTWATKIKDSGMNGLPPLESVNYNSRILGRKGVMSANLVIAPDLLQGAVPQYNDIIKGFSYVPGQRYAEMQPGDKMATMGLTALVAGGTVAVLAKSGFLAKFGKLIIGGIVAIGAGIAALFRKIFGRKEYA